MPDGMKRWATGEAPNRYKGEWLLGKRHGSGSLQYLEIASYEGIAKPVGLMVKSSKAIVIIIPGPPIGEWRADEKHGRGIIRQNGLAQQHWLIISAATKFLYFSYDQL